ncbi:unnamed protein product [Somion occarium]|uniref:Uncharacterized protein n=1 Tax=Somion occarium TaxID=3059160 RepID=A0ABP1E427_9APHY
MSLEDYRLRLFLAPRSQMCSPVSPDNEHMAMLVLPIRPVNKHETLTLTVKANSVSWQSYVDESTIETIDMTAAPPKKWKYNSETEDSHQGTSQQTARVPQVECVRASSHHAERDISPPSECGYVSETESEYTQPSLPLGSILGQLLAEQALHHNNDSLPSVEAAPASDVGSQTQPESETVPESQGSRIDDLKSSVERLILRARWEGIQEGMAQMRGQVKCNCQLMSSAASRNEPGSSGLP